jgi:GH15 family glucan-1,4-alpha-glucosidase
VDRYLPIAEHGLIGDLHTAALVGAEGMIDWYCCPGFDSASVFAAILDRERGGGWRISPGGTDWTSKQLYLPDTNILITRFLSADGVGEIQDFMPIAGCPAHPPHSLIRRVVCVRGRMEFDTEIEPRFDYGRTGHEARPHERGAIFESPRLSLALASPRGR